jgi:hypothetical protein
MIISSKVNALSAANVNGTCLFFQEVGLVVVNYEI